MAIPHSEYQNKIAQGLSCIVERLDQIVGNSTWRAAATNVTTLKALMTAQTISAALHETDKAGFQTAMRVLDEQVTLGIIDDADIAAMNDLASSRLQWTEEDSTLTDHRFGSTR
jgi:hypothetical protein